MKKIFSESTVKIAAEKMRRGERPAYYVSDRLSTEDIARAWRTAAEHTFGRIKRRTPDTVEG